MKNYKIQILALILLLISPALATQITIFHTNDVHGRALADKYAIGYAKIATYVNDYKKKDTNTLLIDAGDAFQGVFFVNHSKGSNVLNVMNMMNYDVMVMGNHEFDHGIKNLFKLEKKANFPFLANNIVNEKGELAFKPYIIKDVSGVKIGIIGVSTPETAYKTHPNNVKGYKFLSPVESTQKYVNILQKEEKVDVIVVLAHLGVDKSSTDRSDVLATEVKGIDFIIDGHSHTTIKDGLVVNGVLIAQTGAYSSALGKVTFDFTNDKVTNKKATLITDFKDVNPDKKIAKYLDSEAKKVEKETSKKVANTTVLWEGERNNVRTKQTNLGYLISHSMVDATNADLAIMNGGGVRTSIKAGKITVGDVINVLPFGNSVVLLEVTGNDILLALENGLKTAPEERGAFPQIAGISVEYNSKNPVGSKVTSVVFDNGQKLEKNKNYKLATNDFIQAGGDEYTMFNGKKMLLQDDTLETVVINYFKNKDADKLVFKNRTLDIAK